MNSLILNRSTLVVFFTASLLVAVFVPLLFNQQMIVGPIVNATLFISTLVLGFRYGVLLSVFPSVIAFSTGLMSLSVLVPFIMIANMILVSSFHYLKEVDYWTAVTVSASLKFLFLHTVVLLLFQSSQAASMMSWPQFLTALLGGGIAFIYLKATS